MFQLRQATRVLRQKAHRGGAEDSGGSLRKNVWLGALPYRGALPGFWAEGEMGLHWGEHQGEDHPHMDVTETIIGAAIKVQKALGPGLLENAYKVCLAHALRLDRHKALLETHLDITYEGLCVPDAYIMDIVVDDKVVVEIKTVERFNDAHFAQLNSYLKFSGLEVGLLLNFRIWPLKEGGIKRIINSRS